MIRCLSIICYYPPGIILKHNSVVRLVPHTRDVESPSNEQMQLLSFVTAHPAHRQAFNTRRTLVGNYTVDHSDIVGASPDGAVPTTS